MLSAIAKNPSITLLRGQYQQFKNVMLRNIGEVTSFPPMIWDRRNTVTFIQINNQSEIHRSMCLKQSLELKSFLLSQ
jgi:hypothetical protein